MFKDCLNTLAVGDLSVPQWKKFGERDIERLPPDEREWFEKNAVKLCARNKDLMKHNIEGLKECEAKGNPVAPFTAIHTGLGQYANQNNGGGLPKDTILAKGAKVLLVSNEWKEAGETLFNLKCLSSFYQKKLIILGLVNGAQGTVVGIIYAPGKRPPEQPSCVLVQFDKYLGKSH